jgi:hypothetical protein
MREKYKRKLVVNKNGQWVKTHFTKLKKGDKFRLYEEDGTQIIVDGEGDFTAYSDVYKNDQGVLTVEIEP